MRLVANEFIKLFSKRVFTICVIVSLVANMFFISYTQLNNPENTAIINNKAEYQQLVDEFAEAENPRALFDSKRKTVEIAVVLNSSSEKEYIDEQAEKYKGKYPTEYQSAVSLDLSREQLEDELLMLQDISAQLDYIGEYDEFIGNMESRADSQKSFAVFAKPDSFSYRNIEKTASDFKRLNAVAPVIENSKALDTATQFQLTDYILLVLVVLVCVFVFSVEREKGLYPLVRSAKGGRGATVLSKLTVALVCSAALCVVYYLGNFIVSGVMFGFGNLSGQIQSSELFMNCSLDVTVFEYLCLWIAGKVIVFCAFALILSFIFIAIKTAAKAYAVVAAFLVAEFCFNLFIDSNSVFANLKHINLIYLMTGNNIFGNYCNVSVFGTPVNIITVLFVLALAVAAAGVVGSYLMFSKVPQIAGKSAVLTRLSEFFARKSKIRGSVSVFGGEAFKHYKTSFVWAVLALLILFGFSNLTSDLSINFNGVEESAYNEYMQTLEGELDEEKYAYIENEQQYFDDLEAEKGEIWEDSALTESEKDEKVQYIQSILDGKGKAFSRVQEQLSYAQSKSEEIGKPPALINELVCKRLTQDTFREWKYFTLLLAAVVFSVSNIFACEHKHSMLNLLRANKNGKSKLLLTKLFTVLLTTVVSFALIYLPYFINFIRTFGTASFNLPLAYSLDFAMLNSSVTVLEFVLILGGVHFAAAVAATLLVYMLSMLLKNNAMTLIVSSGILLVPCVAVMGADGARTVQLFKNGMWLGAVIIIFAICLCVIAVSLFVTFKKFNNVLLTNKIRRERPLCRS